MAAPETLPLQWRRRLPKPWQLSALESLQQWNAGLPKQADLLALPDGWVANFEAAAVQPMAAPALRARLSPQAQAFLAGFFSGSGRGVAPRVGQSLGAVVSR